MRRKVSLSMQHTLLESVEASANRMLRVDLITAEYIAKESVLIGDKWRLVLFLSICKVLHSNRGRHDCWRLG